MFEVNSLLLYKNRPARLAGAADRVEIELEDGQRVKVRTKDVVELHPGPLRSLKDLKPVQGEVRLAWEILAGGQTTLAELAELAYGEFTPSTAWAAWQQVTDGQYFEGSPDQIKAISAEEVERRQAERTRIETERGAWQAFLERAKAGHLLEQDRPRLVGVEALVNGQTRPDSGHESVLKALGRAQTPENAHSLLLELGALPITYNPYPLRLGVSLELNRLPVPPLPDEPRRDLTALIAYAIDDEDTDTPDDAVSLEGNRLWVHIADVAALIPPDSAIDLEARSRALTLHLPEGAIHLLPWAVTEQLGLGLKEISPALSFGIDLDAAGQVTGFEIAPSWVKVTRLSYAQAQDRIADEPLLAALEACLTQVRERRREKGAVLLDFPEIKIKVEEGKVSLKQILEPRSHLIVEESMLLTGIETARFAHAHGIPMTYSQQEAPGSDERPQTLSGMFAFRRLMRRSQFRTTPGAHSGVGAEMYTQVTSPLRRYLDLVGHQQLRAFLSGSPLLNEEQINERIADYEAAVGAVRQAETLSERHWTLVYLLQNPDWVGRGIIVEKHGNAVTALIPDLEWEARIYPPQEVALDSEVTLRATGIQLAQQEASFHITSQ